MNSDKRKRIVFLFLIAGRKLQSSLLSFLSTGDANVINVSYGKGSAKTRSSLIEAFGFVPEENKVIITCLLPRDSADIVIEMLDRKFNFDKPNTGIAFTVAVEALSF